MFAATDLSRTTCGRARRRLWSSTLVLVACLPICALGAKYEGHGTTQAPFVIYTAEEFVMIGNNPGDWNGQFRLMRDIDLSGYDEQNMKMIGQWAALGSTANKPFNGIFDGNNKTIANFTYRDVHSEYVGLFQHVTGEIRDLKLLRPKVVGNGFGTGALIGHLERGGVLGCRLVDVDVSGNNDTGGLVGWANGNVSTSSVTGHVSGVRYVGGFVGHIGKGTIAYSCAKAEVVGNESVGGLAGACTMQEGVVNSCYATGDVDGAYYVGGLVGQLASGRVFRCFSAGRVTGNQYLGGLVGQERALADATASLWDVQTSGQTTSVGGIGKTTAEMKSIDTYLALNFDFFNTWAICEGLNYPVLLWEIPEGDLCCPDGVSFLDFVWFALNWRHGHCSEMNYGCDGADLDDSGDVEFRDLAIFAENWLEGVE